MKVAITGSSGLIGSALTERLRRSGHDVLEMKRGGTDDPGAIWNPDQSWIRDGALDGVDAVVNLAGANIGGRRWSDEYKRTLRSSRIDSTRLLVEHLREHDIHPRVWLQQSAVDFYGNRSDERLDESAPTGEGFLAGLAADWEAEGARAAELGARVVTTRTAFVVAGDAPAYQRMTRPIRLGVGGKLGSGQQWFPWIHLDDLTRAFEFLLTSEVSGAVNASAPETLTNTAMTKVLGSVLHRPTLFFVPGFALKVVLGEMAQPLLLDSKRVVPQALSGAGFDWQYPTFESAVQQAEGRGNS